ncbi:M48 family metallopeptidase [Qipengyuania sp. XHP0207]|uniref:M48 family metallopeptidase n=1 Tax=Qipengyuania sp. XHP0207 TaxID=3038078 RepID=UPI00242045E8|nr:M48 family metallopeptidase [Qipengyuania sp. XHP0207]MDG5747287.1 M48 family metallopeptidase [Qipengyuania sp. XHP0207]
MALKARPLRKQSAFLGAAGLVSAAFFAAPSPAVGQDERPETETQSPLQIFQHREDLLFRVGYRLAVANAEFCDARVPATGMLVHDAAAYGDPRAVRALFNLSGDLAVQSVAPGSPASRAGLRVNDTLVAIAGKAIAETWQPTDPAWKRSQEIREYLDQQLQLGPVRLTWRDAAGMLREAVLEPVESCASRFELLTSSSKASADGDRVLVGEDFPGFGYAEDEFAAMVAHEMAHNLLGHLDYLEETGRKRRLVRLTERDADRLMPWLLVNAGYDPKAAIRFMRQWGPRHGGWIFRKRTHDGWDERIEFIEAEVKKIEAARTAGKMGKADWSLGFIGQSLATRDDGN